MIIKSYEVKKNSINFFKYNFFLLYGENVGLKKDIKETAEKQRNFVSRHEYDLEKFGLNEDQIKSDCAAIYKTFINKEPIL